jgi:hypothetical protein
MLVVVKVVVVVCNEVGVGFIVRVVVMKSELNLS